MHLRGNLILLLTSFIWGTTFVAQMAGMDGLGPFTYAFARFTLGFLFLLGVLWFFRGSRAAARRAGTYHSGYHAGLGAGLIMVVASTLQQYAMLYTTAGKTAFITALYIIFVPIGAYFLGKKIHAENWAGAAAALFGLYLLALHGETGIGAGDLIVLVSSFFWTAQILFIDRFAPLVDPIELATAQIGVCMVGSLVLAAGFEEVALVPILDAWFPIFYGGVMSAGVAFTLQVIGQRYTAPAEAAIMMSFESVFGALGDAVLLGETMSASQVAGCALMFLGMMVTQIRPFLERR